jgi:hypothetical protein
MFVSAIVGSSVLSGGEVMNILTKYCGKCHQEARRGNKEYDVSSLDSLLGTKPTERILKKYPAAKGYVVPEKVAESLTWLRVGTGERPDMPPKGQPAPNADEKRILREWIEKGAKKGEF